MFDTVIKFNPKEELKFVKTHFVVDGKIIKTISKLKALKKHKGQGAYEPDYDYWYEIPTEDRVITLQREEDVKDYGH